MKGSSNSNSRTVHLFGTAVAGRRTTTSILNILSKGIMKMIFTSLLLMGMMTFSVNCCNKNSNVFAHAATGDSTSTSRLSSSSSRCETMETQRECRRMLCQWNDETNTCSIGNNNNRGGGEYETTDKGGNTHRNRKNPTPSPSIVSPDDFTNGNDKNKDEGEGSYWDDVTLDRSDPRDKDHGEITVLVKYKNDKGRDFARLHSRGRAFDLDIPEFHLARVRANAQDLRDMYDDDDIEYFEQEGSVQAIQHNDAQSPSINIKEQIHSLQRNLQESIPYGIKQTQADQMWSLGKGPWQGKIKICVVDTGYAYGHPDLPFGNQNVVGWHDGTHGSWNVDGNGHGTHCAGTIGAIGGNNQGVVGVNYDSDTFELVIGKGLNDWGSGTWGNVINAMSACANYGANVISMSLGGNEYSNAFADATKIAYDKGALIVAAAGNSGGSDTLYPAGYKYVMSVGAVDQYRNIAGFSTHNSQVEIAGPGVNILSTYPNNGYQYLSGTSMACPHVAGIAALVWQHFPECTNTQIRNTLVRTSYDRGQAGCDTYYGYGIVQARNAYEKLKQHGCKFGGPITNPLSNGAKGGCTQDPGFMEPPPPPPPPPTPAPTRYECNGVQEMEFKIDLNFDSYPGDISWKVTRIAAPTIVLLDGGGYTEKLSFMSEYKCLQANEAYLFTISDSYGDGLCCSYGIGNYTVYFNHEEIRFSKLEDPTETVSFGDGGVTSKPTPTPTVKQTPTPTAKPTLAPTTKQTPAPTVKPTSTPTLAPTAKPTLAPTAKQTPAPTTPLTSTPTPAPTTPPTVFTCSSDNGNAELRMELTTDEHPGDIQWDVVDHGTGTMVASGNGQDYEENTLVIEKFCIKANVLYDFNIYDSYGDGLCCLYGYGKYELYYDNVMVASGDKIESGDSAKFGILSPVPTPPPPTPPVCGERNAFCTQRKDCCSNRCRKKRNKCR